MKKKGQGALDALPDADTAKEQVMLERVLRNAKAFYENPNNLQAFKAWLKNKEELNYGTTHINT